MTSNYDKLCNEWAERFSHEDMAGYMSRVPGLEHVDGAYKLRYFGRTLAMTEPGMQISAVGDGYPLHFYDKLNFYTLLWYCKEGASLTGDWQPFVKLRGASPFGAAYQKGIIRPLADTFSGHVDKLADAARTMGAEFLSRGDLSFEVFSFYCIPLRLTFWDGDDEFPANVNLLFDSSATDFIHVESVVTIASQFLSHLVMYSGLDMIGTTF